MSVTILDSEIVHYEVLGRGRPIVFLHDWVGSWRYWIPTMQVSSGQYRSYAVDFWGFGETAHRPERYTLNQQLDLLEKFLEVLGIGKIAVVGHGLGAAIGMMFSEKNPDRVDRILAISLPLRNEGIRPRFQLGSPTELADWLLGENPDHEAARSESLKADPMALQASLNGIDQLNLPDMIRTMQTPRLLVYGGADEAVPVPGDHEFINLPPEAHHMQFEQSGHFPMVDDRNGFNRLLMDFLALPARESPQSLSVKEKWKRRVR